MLAVLVEWGDEKSYEQVDDRSVRVRGPSEDDDYVMTAKLCATTDGERWLFDCGGAWTFVEAVDDGDAPPPPPPCAHPEHRLGTHGRLRKHQRVCLNCGEVVLVRR